MQVAINDTFKFRETELKVKESDCDEDNMCKGCYFEELENLIYNCNVLMLGGDIPFCYGMRRLDRKDVVFVK